MRHRFAIRSFASVVALALGPWSNVNAESSIKVVTAPTGAQQAPTVGADSSIKVGTAPSGAQQAPTASANWSFKVVTAPGEARQAQADVPSAKSQGCSQNEAIMPCLAIQKVLLKPGTGRQINFGRAFANIVVSNEQVIDALPINDHQMFIRPLLRQTVVKQGDTTTTLIETRNEGTSQIFVYDPESKLIGVIEVTIDPLAYNINPPLEDPLMATRTLDVATVEFSTVDIYHGPDLRAPFRYRCYALAGNACDFAGK
jgi:hypothetical protein